MRWFAGIVAVVASSAPAYGNPLELLGLTSRRAAQANTGVASADDATAVYLDPAGLAESPGKDLSIGFVGAYASLRANGDRQKLAEPYGIQLAMRAPLPLRGELGKRFVVGAALHILPGKVARIVAPAPEDATFAYWDRMARTVAVAGLGAKIVDGLWIGASVDVLAGLSGRITANEGITRALDARVDERISTVARAIAGIRWQPTCDWRFGAVFRQRFSIPFRTEARTIVGGEPIDLDLRAEGVFTPHTVVAGIAWSSPVGTIELDGQWAKWSDYAGPFVQVDSRLPLVGEIAGNPPKLLYSDTLGGKLGFESSALGAFVARAGYAFETSPIPEVQTGVSNVLDGTHHTIALGGGWRHDTLRIDIHAQLSLVGERTTQKFEYGGIGEFDPATSILDDDPDAPGFQTTNPGHPSMTSGGRVFGAGITIGVDL